jgi:hypothetical protein
MPALTFTQNNLMAKTNTWKGDVYGGVGFGIYGCWVAFWGMNH